MSTVTTPPALKIGPADQGRRVSLDEFAEADFAEGWLYELDKGVIEVTEVPGINHGRIVQRLARLFALYDVAHPGVINYIAGGGECRLRFPGMQSDRHPDRAVYLTPPPPGNSPWKQWVPQIVVEVLSKGGEARDLVVKRDEYLRAGVLEYWMLDPSRRAFALLQRQGDVWSEQAVASDAVHRPYLLPGLEVRLGDLFGPPDE